MCITKRQKGQFFLFAIAARVPTRKHFRSWVKRAEKFIREQEAQKWLVLPIVKDTDELYCKSRFSSYLQYENIYCRGLELEIESV
jgi:hypothetical protein